MNSVLLSKIDLFNHYSLWVKWGNLDVTEVDDQFYFLQSNRSVPETMSPVYLPRDSHPALLPQWSTVGSPSSLISY